MTKDIAGTFNAALAAAGVAALDELQLFSAMGSSDVNVDEFCRNHDLHRPSVIAMLRVLDKAGVVALDEPQAMVVPGALFAETLENKGYFRWLIGGYGDMLIQMAALVRNANRTGSFINRNGEAIARAAADYGAQFVDRHFHRILAQQPFSVVADLGCGEAARLLDVVQKWPTARGIGVELDHMVAQRASALIARNGFADRLCVLQDDVKRITERPAYFDVDLLVSFFMGHDLWPRNDCLDALRRIHAAFPNATRFLLADTYRSELREEQEVPIFTHGFELTHALMGQTIPTVAEWLDVFSESDWVCVERYGLGIPYSCVFDLRRNS